MSKTNWALKQHRCAVCWWAMPTHADWFRHATEAHGSTLGEFGYDVCLQHGESSACPGVAHAKRLPNEGNPIRRTRVLKPVPYKAKDGTIYIPVPLIEDQSA